jgi:hypothetical protein
MSPSADLVPPNAPALTVHVEPEPSPHSDACLLHLQVRDESGQPVTGEHVVLLSLHHDSGNAPHPPPHITVCAGRPLSLPYRSAVSLMSSADGSAVVEINDDTKRSMRVSALVLGAAKAAVELQRRHFPK